MKNVLVSGLRKIDKLVTILLVSRSGYSAVVFAKDFDVADSQSLTNLEAGCQCMLDIYQTKKSQDFLPAKQFTAVFSSLLFFMMWNLSALQQAFGIHQQYYSLNLEISGTEIAEVLGKGKSLWVAVEPKVMHSKQVGEGRQVN